MVMSPFSTHIARLLDLRMMLAIGFGLFAFSMYLTASLTNQTGFWELFVPQAVRGLALMCCYLPANMIALGTLPPDKLKNAAGLYNLTRDLGGAIGLATIGTVMNDRLHFHWNRLIEDINPARPAVQQFLDTQANRLDALISGDPAAAALKMLANLVQREALVLTYNDLLLLIGGGFRRRPDADAAGPPAADDVLALTTRSRRAEAVMRFKSREQQSDNRPVSVRHE